WHGASWSFMIWGGLHGIYLVINRLWSNSTPAKQLAARTGISGSCWRLACLVLTFHSVCLAWCFFRLTSFSDSLVCVRKWFIFDTGKSFVGGSADVSLWLMLAVYGLAAIGASRFGRRWVLTSETRIVPPPLTRGFQWGFCAALLVLALLLSPAGEKPPFIYFQF